MRRLLHSYLWDTNAEIAFTHMTHKGEILHKGYLRASNSKIYLIVGSALYVGLKKQNSKVFR